MLTKNHDRLTVEVKAHLDADALIGGAYWEPGDSAVGGKGCFIGCLAHSSDASKLGDLYGLPLPLVRICENIHEALWRDAPDEARAFFAAIPQAVGRDGKDLTRVHWAFLGAELRALPKVPAEVQAAIDPVIEGMDRLARGEDWPDAARAAARAADAAARAAADAADAAYAAYAAARAAARKRQRDTILRLIAEAA